MLLSTRTEYFESKGESLGYASLNKALIGRIVFSSFAMQIKCDLMLSANREHPNNSKYQEAASTCSPQLEDKHVSLLQNQSTSRQLTARHEFEIAPSTQPRAAKENIIQSNCRIDSQYVSTVDYQSTCAVENQEAFDNSLTWMSSLPSFQDLVANNYWIDFQGNEISYPREQKVYMTVNPENSRFVGM